METRFLTAGAGAMSYENLLVETHEQIARVVLNRPNVLNALNGKTVEELGNCFGALRTDPAVGAIILTGAGEKAFAAGADITELIALSPDRAMQATRKAQAVCNLIEELGKPTIAAINGLALGGGCELALSCSIRVASHTARLGQPEVKLGITPGGGGTQRLPRLIGKGMALQMILTGAPLTAEDALRWGLVNQIVAPDQLLPAAEGIAKKIVANGPVAVRYCLDAVHRGGDMPLAEALSFEATLFGMSFSTADMREGVRAFLEKRPANFHGY